MGKSSPSAPAAVDPVASAQAQTTSNIQTANALAQINRVNQTGPYSSVNYTQTAPPKLPDVTSYVNSDGTTNQSLTADQQAGGITQTTKTTPGGPDPNAVDTWAQTTSLDPALQSVTDNALNGLSSTNPLAYNAGSGNLSATMQPSGAIQTSVADAGPIQKSLDFSGAPAMPQDNTAAQQAVVNALYGQATSRLDPQWQQAQTEQETKLANQGVVQGSDAWNKAMNTFTQGKNDAYSTALNSSIGAGTNTLTALNADQLANRQEGVNETTSQGTFANTAQQQQDAQNLAAASFANTAQQQQYGQNLGTAQFSNAANEQAFENSLSNANLNNSASAQNIQQLLAQFGLSTGNIVLPGVPASTVQPTDVLGAQGLAQNSALAQYQAQTQANSAAKGGVGSLLGTGAMALALSDRRLKTDVQRIGTARNGLPIYSFRYIGHDEPQIGLMAQDVEKINPAAVHTIAGFKAVEYPAALAA